MAKDRGNRPASPGRSFATPAEPASHDGETPKFCLHFLHRDFDVNCLDPVKQAAFAKTLQKLATSTWAEIKRAGKHGHGTELIPAGQIRAPIPARFQDEEKFTVFRYSGLLPMAGVRVKDVYHVLWIEPEFGRLYDHG